MAKKSRSSAKKNTTTARSTTSQKKQASNQLTSQIARWGTILGLILVVFLFSALLLVAQRAIREPQDVRRDAMVDDGEVRLSAQLSPAQLSVDQPSRIQYLIHTQGKTVNGIEVVFDIITDTFSAEDLQIIGRSPDLTYTFQEVDTVDHGLKVKVTALTTKPTTGFSTQSATPYLELHFTPQKNGDISINFDVERSIASEFQSDPAIDLLRTVAISTYTVGADSSEDDEETDDTTATGGSTPQSCNELCESNNECPVNFRCFNTGSDGKRCRLATNVTSTQCQSSSSTPTVTTPTTSPIPTPAPTTASVQSCNQACTTNNDCDVNLRCYQGSCRLASNPSSLSCSAATAGIVTQEYKKGAAIPRALPTTLTSTPTPSPTPTATPVPTPLSIFPELETEKTAWDEFVEYLQTGRLLENLPAFMSMPLLIIALGIILLLTIIILIIRTSAAARARHNTIAKTASEATSSSSSTARDSTTSPSQTQTTAPPKENPTPPPLPGHGVTTPNTKPSASRNNSMIDRLKKKGVKSPGTE